MATLSVLENLISPTLNSYNVEYEKRSASIMYNRISLRLNYHVILPSLCLLKLICIIHLQEK